MSNELIRAAFEGRLKAWAADKGLTVAWPNINFKPPESRYLRSFLLPNNTRSDDLEGEHRRFLGVYQVSIVEPTGAGSGAAAALADELDALFSAPLTNGALRINLLRPMSASAPIQEPDRWVVPVSASYRADIY